MEKFFNQKHFNNFIWSPLGSRGNIYKFLLSSSLSGVCSLILLQLFATGVNVTGGKFATIPVAICHRCHLPPRIFEKIRNDPNVIIRGLGEGDS
jgi:hypothetical protein